MILSELESVLRERRDAPPPGSYSATLLRDAEHASRKIMEESFELSLELLRERVDRRRAAEEAADLIFHIVAGLVGAGVDVQSVLDELATRRVAGRERP